MINTEWTMPKHTPRPIQTSIINEAIDALNNGYTKIMINAGTGIGKSAIGVTLAGLFDSAYILTRTTQLQNQYISTYPHQLKEIKGRRHYTCEYLTDPKHHFTCEDGRCQYDDSFKKCSECNYNIAKELAMHYPIVLTNYHYLYYTLSQFGERDISILDEAHKLETTLLGLTSETISRRVLNDDLNVELPLLEQPEEYKDYLKVWKDLYKRKWEDTEVPKEKDSYNNKVWKYGWLYDNIDNHEWIVQPNKGYNDNLTSITLKPLYPAQYDSSICKSGHYQVFLTATVGNFSEWCRYNNLNEDDVYYIHAKSPFPVKNRPIIKRYVGRVDYKFWKSRMKLQNLCNTCKDIINSYPENKGVIHCTSHYQAEKLKRANERCITFNDADMSRDEFITWFINSDEPYVYVSPSIKDGVDLRDDACRFQILTNQPNPNMGDNQINKRVTENKDWKWYFYQAAMDLQQAYGRGVRHESDACDFYVLDNRFDDLLRKYSDLFDEYFLEAIQ